MRRGCGLLSRARAPPIHYLVSFFARAGRNSAGNFLTIFVDDAHDIQRGKVPVDPFDPGGKQAGLALRDRPARTRINDYAPSHVCRISNPAPLAPNTSALKESRADSFASENPV